MQNRRRFLKNTLLAATGAGLVSKGYTQSAKNPKNGSENKKFIYRTFGKTAIEIPIVSMGTGNTNNPNLVREALDQGVKLLATSEAYQNGNNETMVGSVLKDRPRDSYMIMTSSGDINWIDTQTGVYKDSFDHSAFMQRVDGSLKRLQVDYVDIFIQPFAATRESVFYEPIRKTMETIKKQGKAKYLGIATHRLEHEAIRAAVDVGIFDVIMTAYNFRRQGWHSMQNGKELDEAIQYATKSGLGIVAMKTMAGVYWDKERTKPINTTAALKWALQNENIHTAVPDCSTYDHLNQNLSIMANLKLTEEEKLDLKPPVEGMSSGLYCQQCNQCIPQCPANLDIPTIMRSYMYAYGYRNLAHARETLCTAGLRSVTCESCNECKVTCQMGFDIKSKILDIARLKDVPEDLIHLG